MLAIGVDPAVGKGYFSNGTLLDQLDMKILTRSTTNHPDHHSHRLPSLFLVRISLLFKKNEGVPFSTTIPFRQSFFVHRFIPSIQTVLLVLFRASLATKPVLFARFSPTPSPLSPPPHSIGRRRAHSTGRFRL
jgi:hypothetical protein